MARICKVCNKEKELKEFARNGKYYKYRCKQCDCENILSKIKITQLYVFSLKTKCEICGYNKNKYALEFHHIDETEKDDSISHMANTRIWSKRTKELIDNEIKKCKCLCANCHRELHHPEDIDTNIDFSFKDINRSKLARETCHKTERFNREQIIEIRNKYNTLNISMNKLAKEYKCNIKTVSKIVRNMTYTNI